MMEPKLLLMMLPFIPLIGALINGSIALITTRREKGVLEIIPTLIGIFFPVLSFVVAVLLFQNLEASPHHLIETGDLGVWMQTDWFTIPFGLTLDPLSGLMILIITGIGSLIHLYSASYLHGERGFARYFATINLFLFFMLLLVLGENLLILFVGWEGVGLCSYLLIGFWFADIEKAAAGKKAFIVNRIGDFGFLAGIFLIATTLAKGATEGASLLSFSYLASHAQLLAPLATIICICLFIGATGKSAQIPLYVWLPDAMAGPTPVSALIHAATMVTAGIYMVIRLHFLFELSPFALHVMRGVGLSTALMAALIGLTQYDIKKVLAYSTVSQLGYLFLALGTGATSAALFHVITHAFFKACLFLGAGSVIHAVHSQDIRDMGGLLKKLPITATTFLISTLAIAGLPPFSGFFSKDEILLNVFLEAPKTYYVLALMTAGITSFYMFRLFVYTFLGTPRSDHSKHAHESSWVMTLPLIILAALALFGGALGVPEILGGSNWIHHWMHEFAIGEMAEVSHSTELTLMGGATLWSLLMVSLAFVLYRRDLNWTKNIKAKLAPLYKTISNKFYVDEVYQAVLVRPLVAVSRVGLADWADQRAIDGVLVGGGPRVALFGGRLFSLLQNGLMGSYLFYFWLALLVFLVLAVG